MACAPNGRAIFSTSWENYVARWDLPWGDRFECNTDSISLDSSEWRMLRELRALEDTVPKGIAVGALPGKGNTGFYFRWATPRLDTLSSEIAGQGDLDSLASPGYLKKVVSHADLVTEVVDGAEERGYRYTTNDTLDVSEGELKTIRFLLKRFAALHERDSLMSWDNNPELTAATAGRKYAYRPSFFINCTEEEDFQKVEGDWLVRDFAQANLRRQWDPSDPSPYEVIEDLDSIVYRYRTRAQVHIRKPQDLRMAHSLLDSIFRADSVTIDAQTEMILFHMGLGTWMRNNWGLWSGKTRLADLFKRRQIAHPDDQSAFLLETCKEALLCKRQGLVCDSLYDKWEN